MAYLKLPKLPERTLARLLPDLKRALDDYVAVYPASYGRKEPLGELILATLASFRDRHFRCVHHEHRKA